MKTLHLNAESVMLLQTILESEIIKLEFNIQDEVYQPHEKLMVMHDMDIIVNMLEQIEQSQPM
jgi:hypothetical protein